MTKSGIKFAAFLAALCFMNAPLTSLADDKKVIMKSVVMDDDSIPFVLDTNGDVWAFKHPLDPSEAFKLPKLHHIKKILPYLALSDDGHVYTWALSEKNQFPVIVDDPPELGDAKMKAFQAIYDAPKELKDLSNVSDIDEGNGHFAAIVNHNQIYEWGNISPLKKINFMPTPKLTYTHDGINSIATDNATTIVLLNNKTIVGWGFNYARLGSDTTEEFSPQNPAIIKAPESITRVFLTSHTIALSDNGNVYFWGDCWIKKDAKVQGIKGVLGVVNGVADMTVDKIDDNRFPNAFVKKDGSVWLAVAPEPENTDRCQDASNTDIIDTPSVPIKGMPTKALTIAMGGDGLMTPYNIIALGIDNTLWGADYKDANLKFEKLNIRFDIDNNK